MALKLCMKMLKLSQDILYCLFHDYLPDGYDWGTEDHKGYHYLQVSGRKVMLTCCDKKWLKHFGLQYARTLGYVQKSSSQENNHSTMTLA